MGQVIYCPKHPLYKYKYFVYLYILLIICFLVIHIAGSKNFYVYADILYKDYQTDDCHASLNHVMVKVCLEKCDYLNVFSMLRNKCASFTFDFSFGSLFRGTTCCTKSSHITREAVRRVSKGTSVAYDTKGLWPIFI